MREALAVMAKAPREGDVKTRLAAVWTARFAAGLYAALLADTFEIVGDARNVRPAIEQFVCHTPEGSECEFGGVAPRNAVFVCQRGATLADRLTNAFDDLFRAGFASVVLMGTDSPTLPAASLVAAFEALDNGADVAIGPTSDGGYYLIGMRRPHPEVFRGVALSTEHALAQTVQAAEGAGLAVALLPEWYDVDTPADLERLRDDLGRNPDGARHTRAFMATASCQNG